MNLWLLPKHTFLLLFKNSYSWLQKVGYGEMVLNRFINPYDEVQETVFYLVKAGVKFTDLLYFFAPKK